MRVGVVGAGALGGTVAALLDRAGHEVAVTARGAHLAAIQADGLHLDGDYGEHVARVDAATVLAAPPELAILAVKAQDAAGAAAANTAALTGVPILVIQNGVTGPQALRDILPDSPLVAGLSMIAASHLEPGRVTVTAAGETVLARDTATAPQLDDVAEVVGGVLPVSTADDLLGLQWSKLLVNQLNAAPAITGVPLQEAMRSPRLATAVAAAMRETARVADASGIRIGGLPSLSPTLLTALRRAPLPVVGGMLRRRIVARMGAVPNPGSTLQSIRRGRPTEIDHLSGAVVERGAAVGVPTPVNRRIVDAVHEVERTGRFLAPDTAARVLLP